MQKPIVLATLLCAAAWARADSASFGPDDIDKAIRAEWKKAKITPASRADDATFLRRLWIDAAGVVPPAEVVTAFLADRSPDKRSKAIDAVLSNPRYAEHWTNYWDEVLMGRQVRAQIVDRLEFRNWLKGQFEKNAPWNLLVYDLITATGQNSPGGTYARAAGLAIARPGDRDQTPEPSGRPINGAVNWLLKYQQAPADLSGTVSKVFLGVQIQCAQCHDHKTEKWTQEDFRRFTACFTTMRPVPIDTGQVRGIRRIEIRDAAFPRFAPRIRPRAEGRLEYLRPDAKALDGTSFESVDNKRQALATWTTAPENPYFSRSIVNRLWGHFLGRGFVDPVDDFRDSNPATMPALLDRIAEDFEQHNFDLKHLIKTICSSEAYQLSSGRSKTTDPDDKLWSRFRLKQLGPEEIVDSLVEATGAGTAMERIAGGNISQVKALLMRQFTFLFDVDEEFDQKQFEGTIPQALLLQNGNLVNRSVSAMPGAALARILADHSSDAERIEALYLRTLSRKPAANETKKWIAFIRERAEATVSDGPAPEPGGRRRPGRLARRGGGFDPLSTARFGGSMQTPETQAYEDLFWALLNSSEFMLNH